MMAHDESSDEDKYPPPFPLEGGLLSTLRERKKREQSKGNKILRGRAVSDDSKESFVPREPEEGPANKMDEEDNYQKETTQDVALLLASVAEIAEREVVVNSPTGQGTPTPSPPPTGQAMPASPQLVNFSTLSVSCNERALDDAADQTMYTPKNTRKRAVSISSPELESRNVPSAHYWQTGRDENLNDSCTGLAVTPPHSPYQTRPRSLSASCINQNAWKHHSDSPLLIPPSLAAPVSPHRPLRPQNIDHKKHSHYKTILRKKFSWKNYPELEAFLIANREEYLRHSTLNYTIQQKQYNNRLTERMLELAAEHGYIFDEHDFSFVTVRDRIRCYYKSYVQSLKKRGVIIGYAARKAGLVTEDELEKSAAITGKIFLPRSA